VSACQEGDNKEVHGGEGCHKTRKEGVREGVQHVKQQEGRHEEPVVHLYQDEQGYEPLWVVLVRYLDVLPDDKEGQEVVHDEHVEHMNGVVVAVFTEGLI
jgi:hypothetical protein